MTSFRKRGIKRREACLELDNIPGAFLVQDAVLHSARAAHDGVALAEGHFGAAVCMKAEVKVVVTNSYKTLKLLSLCSGRGKRRGLTATDVVDGGTLWAGSSLLAEWLLLLLLKVLVCN